MSRRLNMSGFSIAKMRSLFRSGDAGAVDRIFQGLKTQYYEWPTTPLDARAIVERAVMQGVPFGDLETETHLHHRVACAFAQDGQEWLYTEADFYRADSLEVDLWRKVRKHGRPETRAFFRGLIEGVPLFGQGFPEEGEVYAAVPLTKLQFFQPGLIELRDLLAHRSGEEDPTARYASEFCGWVDEIIDAGLDLWYTTG